MIRNAAFSLTILLVLLVHGARASDLANPAVSLPAARVAVGASYHLGAYTITNDSVAVLLNRIHARVSFSPTPVCNFGIDLGATQMDVDSAIIGRDTFQLFHGNYGFSGGAHVKLSTPFFLRGVMAVVGIAQATYFSSENTWKARYGGIDGAGAVGAQFHIKGFGYLTAGPMLYYIRGRNRGFDGTEKTYSNINNLRGWIALDIFPRGALSGDNKSYISLEVTATPQADAGGRVPLREVGISIAVGTVTKRLYGQATDVEWTP